MVSTMGALFLRNKNLLDGPVQELVEQNREAGDGDASLPNLGFDGNDPGFQPRDVLFGGQLFTDWDGFRRWLAPCLPPPPRQNAS